MYLTTWLFNLVVYNTMPDRLSATFAALSDPTRRAILARLASGEVSVKELAEPFEMSLPAVSKHLKVLERAGLIARGREAQWRPCRLEAAPLKGVSDWVNHYRQFWEESFDRLDDYLRRLQERTTQEKDKKEKHHARKNRRK
jgi:DNA-binding transcriptional ArsR family regulator